MELSACFPIWDSLTPEHQALISNAAVLRQAARGTLLHDSSADCLGLLLLCSGQLRAYILSEEGREITLHRSLPHDVCLLSASCVIPDMQFDIMIEAEKDSQFWVIPAWLFRHLMTRSLPVANYANNLMAGLFSDFMWLMEQIMWKSFDRRLAGFLLEEHRLEQTTRLPLTHEKIANHIGTAREVVTRMLRYFQTEGLVRLSRGTVELLDLNRLSDLSGE